MKKAYTYLISFFALAVIFTGCYYFSYRAALEEFNTKSVEKNGELLVQIADSSANSENATTVDSITEDIVTPDTNYILEVYNLKDNQFQETSLPTPEFLIGLSRQEIIGYLAGYMKDVPIEEFDKGLTSYELISMSSKNVVLRKTYNIDTVPYRFFMVVQKGYVTVLYSDKKTVFEYTEIEANNLPEEERNKLIDGINIKDEEELYGILENYSS